MGIIQKMEWLSQQGRLKIESEPDQNGTEFWYKVYLMLGSGKVFDSYCPTLKQCIEVIYTSLRVYYFNKNLHDPTLWN